MRRWFRNRLSDFLEREILEAPTSWCLYRDPKAQCQYPSQLDPKASRAAGHPVWEISDRGACPRTQWQEQMTCPIGEAGPEVGGPPRPKPYAVGGQHDSPLTTIRYADALPTAVPPAFVARLRSDHVVVDHVDSEGVASLQGGHNAQASELFFPTFDATAGLKTN